MSRDRKIGIYQGKAFLIVMVCLLVLQGFLSGCSGCIKDPVDDALVALDRAINKLEGESANWRSVLNDLKEELPDEIQSTIRNEVNDVATRAIAAAGAEFRCNEEFIREQILSDLKHIKARLTGQPVPPKEPRVCHSVPSFVTAALVPDRLNHLEFDGYNLDTTGFQVLHQSGTTTTDVSQYLDRPSHYMLTLNLGSSGVQLNSNSRRFILKWNGEELYTVGITPRPTPIPVRNTLRISGKVDVNDDDWGNDDHKTFTVNWSVTLTPENPTASYQDEWCVDEVRGELDIYINLDPSSQRVFGNGVSRTYEYTSGSCGGNDLDKTHTFNFDLQPGERWVYDAKLEDAGDYADFDLTFQNIEE